MKPDTAIILAAAAAAVALVMWPRPARAAATAASAPQTARVGAGDASTVWTDADSERYRAQLSKEMGNNSQDWSVM